MSEIIVTVAFAPLGDTQTGCWCEQCQLPSAFEQTGLLSFGGRTTLRKLRWCLDCGSHELVGA